MFVTGSRQLTVKATSSRILLGSARINDPSFLVGPYQTTHNLFSTSAAAAECCWLSSTAEKPNHLNCSLRVPEKRAYGPLLFMTAMPRVHSLFIHFFPSSDFAAAAACQHFDLWVINATIKNVDTPDVDNSKQAKTHWDSNLYCSTYWWSEWKRVSGMVC